MNDKEILIINSWQRMSTVKNSQQKKPMLTFGCFRFSEYQTLTPLKANFTILPRNVTERVFIYS